MTKAALLLCVFDEEDAWSAPPRANDGDCNTFEHENDISAFSFASQRLLWVCFVIRCVVKLRAFRSQLSFFYYSGARIERGVFLRETLNVTKNKKKSLNFFPRNKKKPSFVFVVMGNAALTKASGRSCVPGGKASSSSSSSMDERIDALVLRLHEGKIIVVYVVVYVVITYRVS